jgi:hypothetical protein
MGLLQVNYIKNHNYTEGILMKFRELGRKMSAGAATLAQRGKEEFREFLHNEDGDTNFISILILLGIGLALAAVFFIFRDQIVNWFRENVVTFFERAPVR